MLVKCPECGKEMSDKADKCPNCGCPVETPWEDFIAEDEKNASQDVVLELNGQQINMTQIWYANREKDKVLNILKKEYKATSKQANDLFKKFSKEFGAREINRTTKKNSKLSAWAAVLALFTITAPIGFLVALVDFSKRDKETKHTGSWFAVIFFILMCVVYGSSSKNDTPKPTPSQSETTTENSTTTAFDTGEIFNDKDCIISVSSGDEKSITFCIENNSSKDYSFDIHSLAINGVMTNCNIYTLNTEVPSGKKSNATLNFEKEWTDASGTPEYIDILFWAYDNAVSSKDYETNIVRVKTNNYTSDKTYQPESSPVDTNGLNISLSSMTNDSITVSIINNNDYYVQYDLKNSSINDWSYGPDYNIMDVAVFPNCVSMFTINLSDDFKTENSIDSINQFEFSLGLRPSGDYFNEVETEKIIFSK